MSAVQTVDTLALEQNKLKYSLEQRFPHLVLSVFLVFVPDQRP